MGYQNEVPCRSEKMKLEEIERERAMSGWNQYVGEEEQDWNRPEKTKREKRGGKQVQAEPGKTEQTAQGRIEQGQAEQSRIEQGQPGQSRIEQGQAEHGQVEPGQMERTDGRYRAQEPDQETMWHIKEQEARERDLRHLQALYPETARILLPYVEEACDRLEYEGSMMYDERPDYETVLRISSGVLEQVKDQFEPIEEAPRDEMLSMQYRRPRRRRRSGSWLGDFVQTMLLEEMHRRRCRRCRMR